MTDDDDDNDYTAVSLTADNYTKSSDPKLLICYIKDLKQVINAQKATIQEYEKIHNKIKSCHPKNTEK